MAVWRMLTDTEHLLHKGEFVFLASIEKMESELLQVFLFK